MSHYPLRPRILFVTPEVAFVPERNGNRSRYIDAGDGGFGGFLAEFIDNLLNLGIDVHVAQPDYRKLFEMRSRREQANPRITLPIDRIHLAEDRAFFYANSIHSNYAWENIEISLIFQREVINQILPRVQPDLIHCHDWMTGLIPAAAKAYEISCLYTVHNYDSAKSFLSHVEERGIDAASFWQHLFYDRFPGDYEETRSTNRLDLLFSGILAAHHVETASFQILPNIVKPRGTVFNICETAYCYLNLYERILHRPLVAPQNIISRTKNKKNLTKATDRRVITYPKARAFKPNLPYNKRISTLAASHI